MKKLIVLSVMAALVCALGAPAAFAGVQDSRHDMASGSLPGIYSTNLGTLNLFGTCSACHLPHGAGAERLFPSKSVAATGGFFAPLCGSCHDDGIVTTNGGDVNFNTTVIQANAHGLSNSILAAYGNHDGVAGGQAATAGLVYLTSGQSPRTPQVDEIECLSCHDVHNQNGFRPFMEIDLDDLCEACHLNRVNAATGTSGWANAGFGGGSTHPSGSAYTGDVAGIATPVTSNSPFNVAGIDAVLVSNPDGGTGTGSDWGDGAWNSGMQLEAQATATWGSGGVDCITCHNVHWDEDDATPYNGSNYLGIVFDNLGGPANDFCEFCHRGSNAVPADMQGTEGNPATSLYFWNPGGQAYSHPNDDVGSVDDAIQASDLNLPLGLRAPTSSRTGTARSGIVCTSCHGIHPTDSTTPETEDASPILLNYDQTAYGDVCEACHDTTAAANFQHHPVGTAYVTLGNDAGSPPSAGLTCAGGIQGGTPQNQCHGSGGGTANGGWMAHNRTAALGAPPTINSTMCTDCHSVNPSTYTPANTWTANELASHFVGDAAANFTTRSTDCGTDGITYAGSGCSDGTAATWTGSGLPSLFGATVSDIICESCHRLAAGNVESGNRTADPVNLLVEVSGHDVVIINEADAVQGAADYTGAVYMCTGCHHVPVGTHPLAEANGASYVIPAATSGHRYTTSLAAGSVNCESCHSPHDAETITGSFILDAGATSGGGVTGMEPHPALDYTGFCAVCHGGFN